MCRLDYCIESAEDWICVELAVKSSYLEPIVTSREASGRIPVTATSLAPNHLEFVRDVTVVTVIV